MILLGILLCLVGDVSGVYNTLDTWEHRCFVEDVPDNTMITYKWSINMFNDNTEGFDTTPSKHARVLLRIVKERGLDGKKSSGEIKREQDLKNGEGVVKFYAQDYGEYMICFELQASEGEKYERTKARLHISPSRDYSEDDTDFIEETTASITSSLTNSLRKVRSIRAEQKYYRKRELEFRATSYLTSSRVLWYAVLTSLTAIGSGCFMVLNMKSFFLKKKLV